jgi:hypothetical protein
MVRRGTPAIEADGEGFKQREQFVANEVLPGVLGSVLSDATASFVAIKLSNVSTASERQCSSTGDL